MVRLLFPVLLLLIMSCAPSDPGDRPITLPELAVTVSGDSREVGFTNKRAGFYYTETSGAHRTGWQGWHVFSHKILDDYLLAIDGDPLDRSAATVVTVFPHQFRREYPGGVQETVTLLDSIDALVIQLTGLSPGMLTVAPLIRDAAGRDEFVLRGHGQSLLMARRRDLDDRTPRQYPPWLGVRIAGAGTSLKPGGDSSFAGSGFSPATVRFLPSGPNAVVIFAAGSTEQATAELLVYASEQATALIAGRRERMEKLLNDSYVRTNHARFDKALHWAMISMDALVMEQGKKGIFAGLPWFSNYWGRDSFIALPGATLVTGQFEEAREILASFAQWQAKDPAQPAYGRIPNLVNPFSISYNTTDGTPWFVIALGEYVRSSGDHEFARTLFPVVRRSVEGAWKHHTDADGFLTHGDGETWMDAVGTSGPWSPRGNRANDIQALWHGQLATASWLARISGQESFARRCDSAAAKVRRSFLRYFVDANLPQVYDHLNADGTADLQMRPNQLFVFDLLNGNDRLAADLFKQITEQLVYPHGVASLSQNDSAFHPYHHHSPYYVQDAAYHNGIVWTWLAGPWIRQAVRLGHQDLAFRVTENMVDQLMDRGAVGTLSELLDAAPRPGEDLPRLSGTFSQAWSLAEFIRSFYQDYLGVQVDVPGGVLHLRPRLPSPLRQVRAHIRVADAVVRLSIRSSASDARLELSVPAGCPALNLIVDGAPSPGVRQRFTLPLSEGTTLLSMTGSVVTCTVNGQQVPVASAVEDVRTPDVIRLAVPAVDPGLPSLRGPGHRMLTHAEIASTNPDATTSVDLVDPERDDVGTGRYQYPATPHLRPGSLDLTRFTVAADDERVYFTLQFRELSDPGWHPEYGFQLTFAAIAVRTDDAPEGKGREIGMNSLAAVPAEYAFDRLIAVGGGVRVSDGSGKILAEYLPRPGDEARPLGSTSTRTVAFALPRDLLGTAEHQWRYAVFVGAQDDHGGAGIGEFRTVGREAGEWVGGGKRRPSDPNVYDTLFGSPATSTAVSSTNTQRKE